MRRSRRSFLIKLGPVVLLGAALSTGLSACHTYLPDPLAFTVINGQPVVRTCIPLTITEVEVGTYDGEDDYESETYWSAQGSDYFPAGSEFVLGNGPEGFVVDVNEASIDLNETLSVSVDVDSASGGSWETFSRIEANTLVEGIWLDGWGDETEVPCGRGECLPSSVCMNAWPIPTGYPLNPESTFVPTSVTPTPTPTP